MRTLLTVYQVGALSSCLLLLVIVNFNFIGTSSLNVNGTERILSLKQNVNTLTRLIFNNKNINDISENLIENNTNLFINTVPKSWSLKSDSFVSFKRCTDYTPCGKFTYRHASHRFFVCKDGIEFCTFFPTFYSRFSKYKCGRCQILEDVTLTSESNNLKTSPSRSLLANVQVKTVVNVSKATYIQGETLLLSYETSGLGSVPFKYYDSILIVRSNITKDYLYAPYVLFAFLEGLNQSKNGSKSILVNWDIGEYKVVLFNQEHDVLAISRNFRVNTARVTLNSNKKTYVQGDNLDIILKNLDGVLFGYWDLVRIIPSNIMKNYKNTTAVGESFLFDQSGHPNVTKSFVVSYKVGSYKAVYFIDGREQAVAVSSRFNVTKFPCSIKSIKSVNKQYDPFVLKLTTTSGLKFRYLDELRIVDANVMRDYYNAPSYWTDFLYETGGPIVEKTISCVGWYPGNYKLVLFLEGSQIPLAVSNKFSVV